MATDTVNVRRALAGLNLLQGMRQGEALRQAGFAASTARNPKGNGIGAQQCLDEAAKVSGEDLAAKIAATARARLAAELDAYEVGDLPLDRLARAVDITEKWYGDRAERGNQADSGVMTIHQRILKVQTLIVAAQISS